MKKFNIIIKIALISLILCYTVVDSFAWYTRNGLQREEVDTAGFSITNTYNAAPDIFKTTISYKNVGQDWEVIQNSTRTHDTALVSDEVQLSLGDTNVTQIKIAIKNASSEKQTCSLSVKDLHIPEEFASYMSLSISYPFLKIIDIDDFTYSEDEGVYKSGVYPLIENLSIKSLQTYTLIISMSLSDVITGTSIMLLTNNDSSYASYHNDDNDEDYYFYVTEYSLEDDTIRSASMIDKDGNYVDSNFNITTNPEDFVDYQTITGNDYTNMGKTIVPFGLSKKSLYLDGFVVIRL